MNCDMKKAFAVLALLSMLILSATAYEADAEDFLQGYGEGEGIVVTYEEALSEGKLIGTLLIELSDAPSCSSYTVSVDKTAVVLPRSSLLGGNEFRLGSDNYILLPGVHTVSVTADDYIVTCSLVVGDVSIELNRTSVSLIEGDMVPLFCISEYDVGNIQWSSSNPDVATVSNGLVTAVGAGQATITASYLGTSTATCTVNVSGSESDVFYFFIKYDTESAGTELLDTVELGNITEDELTEGFWIKTKADNAANALVAVSESLQTSLLFSDYFYGWLDTFMGLGTVSIDSSTFAYWTQYSWDGGWVFNDVCLGYIEAAPQEQYIAMVFCVSTMEGDSEALDQDPYDIPVSVRNMSAVEFAVDSLTIDGGNRTMYIGDESVLFCEISPSSVPQLSVAWTVEDQSIVSLSDGTVSAIAAGTTTVTASCGGTTDTITITVLDGKAKRVTLSQSQLSISLGHSAELSATVEPSYALNKNVTWSTSDEDVAVVDQNGKVTSVSVGTAVITATSVSDPSVSGTCTVTVVDTPVTGVSLDESAMTVPIGGTATLTATVSPSDATIADVVWSSSDATIAAVDQDGTVSGIKEGKATITVTTVDGGYTDTCVITVMVGYKVQFEVFGGTLIEDMIYFTVPEDTLLPNAEKSGCKFVGWYDNVNLSGSIVKKIPAMSSGDMKLYACFVSVDRSYYIDSVGVRGFANNGTVAIIDIDAGENAPDKVLSITYSTVVDLEEGSFIYPFNKATVEVPATENAVSFSPDDGSSMLSITVFCSYMMDNVFLSTTVTSEFCSDVSADADVSIDADAVLKFNGMTVNNGDRIRFGIYVVNVTGTAGGYTVNGIDANGTNTIYYHGQKLIVSANA